MCLVSNCGRVVSNNPPATLVDGDDDEEAGRRWRRREFFLDGGAETPFPKRLRVVCLSAEPTSYPHLPAVCGRVVLVFCCLDSSLLRPVAVAGLLDMEKSLQLLYY